MIFDNEYGYPSFTAAFCALEQGRIAKTSHVRIMGEDYKLVKSKYKQNTCLTWVRRTLKTEGGK